MEARIFIPLVIILGGISLLILNVRLRRSSTIRLVVKKKPRKLPSIITRILNIITEANDGLKAWFGEYHLWKFGSLFYGLIFVGLLFNFRMLGDSDLFTIRLIFWFGGGVAGLVLLSVKGYGAGEGGCGCLGLLLESLSGEFAILGIIPLLIFTALGPIILITALIINPREKK